MAHRAGAAGYEITNKKLMRELKSLVHQAEEVLALGAEDRTEAGQEARTKLGQALESARTTYEELHESVIARVKRTNEVIHDHPYRSMGIAFGVGLLLGAFACRK